MAGAKIALSGSAGELQTDAYDNAKVNTPLDETEAGFSAFAVENDAGDITGSRSVSTSEITGDYRLRVGVDSLRFSKNFSAAAINSAVWTAPVTTMTVTQTGGYATLNAGLSVASGAVARLTSYASFVTYFGAGLSSRLRVQFTQAPVANNVCEWGHFIATGTAAPTDGIFFRYNAAGQFVCVYSVGGTEVTSSVLDSSALVGINSTKLFSIDILGHAARFWIGTQMVWSVENPSGVGIIQSQSLPLSFRCYNSAATGAAQTMKIAGVAVYLADANAGLQWPTIAATMGDCGYQGQDGGTMGSAANYANSANPTAAVPTNTTAALGSGLGGQFWETDTLAVTTDGIISSFQNLAGTNAIPGKTLMISGVTISSAVQTALTGGGYLASWSLAFGHTAVSLATTEAATTKAPRRVPLGFQTVASAAVALTQLSTITIKFDNPIPVYPGEFIQTVKKKIGTAPSAGVIAHLITFDSVYI